MPYIVPRKRSRPVVVAIRPPERAKDLLPLRLIVQLVSVSERVSRLMPQVHHDFSRVFEVMRFFFQLRQRRMRQVERNPDNRLARRASPLIGQVTSRTKLRQPLGVQLAIKLFDKPLHRRPSQRKPQLADRPAQKFAVRDLLRGRFSFCDVGVSHNAMHFCCAQALAHKESRTAPAHMGRDSITTVSSNGMRGYLEVTAVMRGTFAIPAACPLIHLPRALANTIMGCHGSRQL